MSGATNSVLPARLRGFLVGAALALASCSEQDDGDPAAAAVPLFEEAAAPHAVAGMWGLRSRSTVVFDALPTDPHSLSAVFAFPDRGYWRLEPSAGSRSRRRLVYRAGEHIFHIEPLSSDSIELEGRQRLAALLQIELREAAMLWPDGLAWTPGRDPDRIELPGIGAIEATGAEERPTEFHAYDLDGELQESLTEVEWAQSDERSWPRRWILSTPAGLVWREEILEVFGDGLYSDLCFLPPDRLPAVELRGQTSLDPGAVQKIEIPARCARRFPLAEGLSWSEAVTRARQLLERWSPRLEPLKLDSRTEIELSLDGQPVAIRLRLLDARVEPRPEGWQHVDRTVGASQFVPLTQRVASGLIRRLREALPEGREAGRPYLRLPPEEGAEEWAQIVVPAMSEQG